MQQIWFNITLALRALGNNRLRSGITITVIALGIMSLISILTGIDVMKEALSNGLSTMGANTFQINSLVLKKSKKGGVHISITEGKDITYSEAMLFKERFHYPATIALGFVATEGAVVRSSVAKTNPTISVLGIDDNYVVVKEMKLGAGRSFTQFETQAGKYVCIIGDAIARKLFPNNPKSAIGNVVTVGSIMCRVVGIAAPDGTSFVNDRDNSVFLPLQTARQVYGGDNSYTITIKVLDVATKAYAIDEAEGIFRVIRRVKLGVEPDFHISQSDELVNLLLENTVIIEAAAVVICLITLLNSIIGLMNIMLESVAERTREIGVSKALGAKNVSIRGQFLTEALLISILGGIIGIAAGVGVGNIVGIFFKVPFIIPWGWTVLGVSLCIIVGVISGIYPSIKASKLDPIVALRYE